MTMIVLMKIIILMTIMTMAIMMTGRRWRIITNVKVKQTDVHQAAIGLGGATPRPPLQCNDMCYVLDFDAFKCTVLDFKKCTMLDLKQINTELKAA